MYNQAKRLDLKKKNLSVKYDCYVLLLHVNQYYEYENESFHIHFFRNYRALNFSITN